MKSLFLILTLLVLGACEAPSTAAQPMEITPKVIDKSDLNHLQSEYEQYYFSSSESGDNDPVWTPEVILPRIHTWFTVGLGLKRAKNVSDYLIYELNTIPDEVIEQLQSRLLPHRYSLAVITSSFWKQVQEAQRKGFRLGFISSKSPSRASGVYFSGKNLIAFLIIAEPGTLPHELRHAEQYKALAPQYESYEISESCMGDLRYAFGEIDATTFESAYYSGVENEFDGLVSRNGTNALLALPQSRLFLTNLEYPVRVSLKAMKNDSCPAEIKETMKQLHSFFSSRLEFLTSQLSGIASLSIQQERKQLTYAQMRCDSVSSEKCKKLEDFITNSLKEIAISKTDFKNLILSENALRTDAITKQLNKLPTSQIREMCSGALGVAFYTECE
jgi:hypothetical protein